MKNFFPKEYKKNKNFFLSSRGKKYLEIIKIVHSIYGIKSSG